VHDAAPGGHPLQAAGLEQADVAHSVVVAHAPGQHVGDGLEAAVGMVGEPANVVVRPVGAEGVEHQEGIEPAPQGRRQHPGEFDPGAVGGGLALHLLLDTARTSQRLGWKKGRGGSRGEHHGTTVRSRQPATHQAF
jgi:hypothetical protein